MIYKSIDTYLKLTFHRNLSEKEVDALLELLESQGIDIKFYDFNEVSLQLKLELYNNEDEIDIKLVDLPEYVVTYKFYTQINDNEMWTK